MAGVLSNIKSKLGMSNNDAQTDDYEAYEDYDEYDEYDEYDDYADDWYE